MPVFDSLGQRMKFYEGLVGSQLMPLIPAIVRLDGKAFHTFTRGLVRPFDMNLVNLMQDTTKFLVEETNACIGYTQSDEITLILMSNSFDSQIYFDGRVDKINSILASKCSVYFNSKLPSYLSSKVNAFPVFDCRCFNVPNEQEAVNALVWREQDATRNSIQMVGQANFSHTQLMNKSCPEIQEMLFSEKGINWNKFPATCKRGTYVQRKLTKRAFTTEEIEKLPEKHAARFNPELIVERHDVFLLNMPPITKVTNIMDVVFRGAEPTEAKNV